MWANAPGKAVLREDSMPDNKLTREDALSFHMHPSPGKFEVQATVPMTTQRDLSLAYSPGVAVPCEEIAANPETADRKSTRLNSSH